MLFLLRFYFALIVFISPFVGVSQTSPIYSNEFLGIGTGARALALGGAVTSSVQVEESGYWNPAFLSSLNNKQHISLMHSEYFGGIAAYDYLSFVSPIDSISGFSISVIRLGVDDIPDTRLLYDAGGVINYDNISFFSAVDLAVFLSYGRKLPIGNGLSVGGNVKIINRKAGDFAKSWGFGIDLAAVYQVNDWNFGAVFRDVSTTFNAWSHSTDLIDEVYAYSGNVLPQNSMELTLPSFSIGVNRTVMEKGKLKLMAMQDLKITFDGKRNTLISSNLLSIDPLSALELGYQEMLWFRIGFAKWQKTFLSNSWMAEMSAGVGFKYKSFKLHYSLNRNNGFESNHYSHGVSLNFEMLKN